MEKNDRVIRASYQTNEKKQRRGNEEVKRKLESDRQKQIDERIDIWTNRQIDLRN